MVVQEEATSQYLNLGSLVHWDLSKPVVLSGKDPLLASLFLLLSQDLVVQEGLLKLGNQVQWRFPLAPLLQFCEDWLVSFSFQDVELDLAGQGNVMTFLRAIFRSWLSNVPIEASACGWQGSDNREA